MMKLIKLILICFFVFYFDNSKSKSWCKAVYQQNTMPGELQKQINKCKNYDNFFLAIHSNFKNSGHLLNSFIAEYCDLKRTIHTSEPRQGDPFFTVVCEFRKNYLRE